jgi:hypothetical protein
MAYPFNDPYACEDHQKDKDRHLDNVHGFF